MINISSTATFQFIIASASWIVMTRIMSSISTEAVAGYQVAIRILIFFILPAWGFSNAAATLVGQNLGAGQPDRAEKSVWVTAKYNAIFMGFVSVLFLVFSGPIVSMVNNDVDIKKIATEALRIISLGYILYGVGMVMANAFNGAGDTRTPTWINFFGFWIVQIPLAYFLAISIGWQEKGVFYAILFAEGLITVIAVVFFKRGKWKQVVV
jgi:Na+-driven multidrug efflux pump